MNNNLTVGVMNSATNDFRTMKLGVFKTLIENSKCSYDVYYDYLLVVVHTPFAWTAYAVSPIL